MTEAQADALAAHVREAGHVGAHVEREGHYFVVAVQTRERGKVILRDEVDWDWLRREVLEHDDD
jgi:hypothetical protein